MRAAVLLVIIVSLVAAAVALSRWHGLEESRHVAAGDRVRLASGLQFSLQNGWSGTYTKTRPDVPFLSAGSETLELTSRDASGDVESLLAHDTFGGPLAVRTKARHVTITRNGRYVVVQTMLPGSSDGYVRFGAQHGDVMRSFRRFWASVSLGTASAL